MRNKRGIEALHPKHDIKGGVDKNGGRRAGFCRGPGGNKKNDGPTIKKGGWVTGASQLWLLKRNSNTAMSGQGGEKVHSGPWILATFSLSSEGELTDQHHTGKRTSHGMYRIQGGGGGVIQTLLVAKATSSQKQVKTKSESNSWATFQR